MKKTIIPITIITTLTVGMAVISAYIPNLETSAQTTETIQNDFIQSVTTIEQNDWNRSNARDRVQEKSYTYSNTQFFDIRVNNYNMYQKLETVLGLQKSLRNFFIMQITPYTRVEATAGQLNISINFNFLPIDTQSQQVLYEFYETTDNLSNFINMSNWTTNEPHAFYTSAKNTQNKTLLKNDSITLTPTQTTKTVNLGNLNMQQAQTTYIFGYMNTSGYSAEEYNPEIDEHCLYCDNITINSVLAHGTITEVIDLPGLMFNILTMPFSFISQAFNLTLFPGTPYQFNFSNFFLGIIAVCIFLWIIKLILGKADLGDMIGNSKHKQNNDKNNKKDNKKEDNN